MMVQKKKGEQTTISHPDWTKDTNSTVRHGHGLKDVFLKKERITFPHEIMNVEKKKGVPPIGRYNPEKPYKILNVPKLQMEKGTIVADAVVQGMQTPGHIYNIEDGEKLTTPRIFVAKYQKPKEGPGNYYKIKKVQGPDMGSYKDLESFKAT